MRAAGQFRLKVKRHTPLHFSTPPSFPIFPQSAQHVVDLLRVSLTSHFGMATAQIWALRSG